MKRLLRLRLQTVAYLFVVGMSAFGLWLVDQQANALDTEIEDRTRGNCEISNAGRALTRDIAVEVGVESAEAIIEIAAAGDDPPSPEVIDAYRAAVQRRMEAIAAQLEDRDCAAELADN